MSALMKNIASSTAVDRLYRWTKLPFPIRLCITVGLLSSSGLMGAKNWSSDLTALPPSSSVDVIVQFRNPPTTLDLAAITHAGGTHRTTFKNIRGALFTIPVGAL